jgi:hypothetical protein
MGIARVPPPPKTKIPTVVSLISTSLMAQNNPTATTRRMGKAVSFGNGWLLHHRLLTIITQSTTAYITSKPPINRTTPNTNKLP